MKKVNMKVSSTFGNADRYFTGVQECGPDPDTSLLISRPDIRLMKKLVKFMRAHGRSMGITKISVWPHRKSLKNKSLNYR